MVETSRKTPDTCSGTVPIRGRQGNSTRLEEIRSSLQKKTTTPSLRD